MTYAIRKECTNCLTWRSCSGGWAGLDLLKSSYRPEPRDAQCYGRQQIINEWFGKTGPLLFIVRLPGGLHWHAAYSEKKQYKSSVATYKLSDFSSQEWELIVWYHISISLLSAHHLRSIHCFHYLRIVRDFSKNLTKKEWQKGFGLGAQSFKSGPENVRGLASQKA